MKRFTSILMLLVLPIFALSTYSATWESFPLRDNGSIPIWQVAGPLPYTPVYHNDEKSIGFYVDFLYKQGGETEFIPSEGDKFDYESGKTVAWKTGVSDEAGLLNYLNILESTWLTQGVVYSFCELVAEESKEVLLKVRSNDGVRVWVNDKLVHSNHVGRKVDQEVDLVKVSLKKGRNRLLGKVDQMGGGWGLLITVFEANGDPVQGVKSGVHTDNAFKNKIKSVDFISSPLVLKTPEGERQLITASLESGGLRDAKCRFTSKSWDKSYEFPIGDIPLGTHRFEFKIPSTSEPVDVLFTTSTDSKEQKGLIIQTPKKWMIYLLQHTHTDIGYTRPQTEILPAHLQYIDYALDFCDLTDDYPDDAKFRWTCEISWVVREYLMRRPPEQIERLKKRVAEGRIEIAGMFLNMAEIADESSLASSLQSLRAINQQFDVPVRTTMQNDVNGAGWCLVDYFEDIGIEYLTMGINKTRSLLPFDRPTCFWWESPSGSRVMVHRSDHYHTGNMWKIHSGEMPPFKTGLLGYLKFLDEREYPFDRIAVKFSGYHTDNSPPSTVACELVKQWNETYAWPQLRLSTAHEFLDYVKENHGDELAVHKQSWPDWWTDGFGSAARETGASRDTHVAMQVNQTLLAMSSLLGADIKKDVMKRADSVHEQLLFYDEHTYGAAESISDPMAENTMVQWGEKASYVWNGVKQAGMLREEALGLLQGTIPRGDHPTIAVFNTLNWERSGEVKVFIDHEILATDGKRCIVNPVTGDIVPAQLLSNRAEGSYWALWADDVPALGYKIFNIEPRKEAVEQKDNPTDVSILENDFYRILIDQQTGAITSLVDKQTKIELCDDSCKWDLGQFIYEKLKSSSTVPGSRELRKGAFEHSSLRDVKIQNGKNGPIWRSVIISGEADGCAVPGGVHCEIRLYETEKRIEFHYAIRKNPITEPEAVYVAFPFNLDDGKFIYEGQGGVVRPGIDQIPRSSSDWQTVQNFLTLRNDNQQVILVCDQAPLVQFGDINLGKWQDTLKIDNPHVYSWIMNNYWFTNFRASQQGEFKWRYALTSTEDNRMKTASRFGWGSRVPMVARPLPPVKKASNKQPEALSALDIDSENLLLVEAHPSRYGKGVILHLREIEGKEQSIPIKNLSEIQKIRRVDEVNVLEKVIDKKLKKLTFKPHEVKFVKLTF